jgi:ABC-type Mn2+/Zn2+ transport system ATPase subunit
VEAAVENKLIEIENFSFSIDRKSILKDISVSIKKGEYVSIVGPQWGWENHAHKMS